MKTYRFLLSALQILTIFSYLINICSEAFGILIVEMFRTKDLCQILSKRKLRKGKKVKWFWWHLIRNYHDLYFMNI